ncbi:CotH kinase family protein [Armatimonas sp.]|uniref:CotH kinase family protein n=1 Tax=Armatimonas sp. TaxID=1872638 RepID=UPI00374DC135
MNSLYSLTTLAALVALVDPSAIAQDKTGATFFVPTQVHTIQLALTQEQWDSMTPSRGQPGAPGSMGMEFPEIKSSVTVDGKDYVVGLRFKGNSSYMSSSRGLKRPFKIDFNQYVKAQSHQGVTKLNLNNNFSDRTQIRETLAYEIFRRMGLPSPRTSLAKVSLTLAGEEKSLGLYTLAQQVDSNFLKEYFGTGDGMLLKPEGARGGITYLGDDWARYEKGYDPKGKPTTQEKARLIAFAKLVHQSDEATFQKEIGNFLDTEGFAKFLAATAVTSNGDNMFAMGHNFYLWLNPKTNKFVYLPWDLNMAFGGFPIGDPIHLSVKKPYNGESRLTDRFLAIPEFRAAYNKSCREGAKIMTELDALHDSLASAAKPIMALDPKDGGGGFPDGPGGRRGGGPGGQGGGFGGTNDLKVFFAQRSASVIAQLEGKEEGVVPQGGGPGGGGPGGPGGPGGGFDMAAMLGTSFLQLTGAGEAPTLTAFNDAWKKGAVFCDKNKDGKLTQEELTAGVGAVLGGGFGPGQFLGPQIWSALKAKESISVATFTATMAQWGASWDTNKDGKLNVPEVGAGLAKILPPPDFGGGF